MKQPCDLTWNIPTRTDFPVSPDTPELFVIIPLCPIMSLFISLGYFISVAAFGSCRRKRTRRGISGKMLEGICSSRNYDDSDIDLLSFLFFSLFVVVVVFFFFFFLQRTDVSTERYPPDENPDPA